MRMRLRGGVVRRGAVMFPEGAGSVSVKCFRGGCGWHLTSAEKWCEGVVAQFSWRPDRKGGQAVAL